MKAKSLCCVQGCSVLESLAISKSSTGFQYQEKIWTNSGETFFYISTIVLSSQEFYQAILNHWGIENRNHYVRDVTLGEGKLRIRTNLHIFAKL
jgi:predicted transposase YbfD/YdcC